MEMEKGTGCRGRNKGRRRTDRLQGGLSLEGRDRRESNMETNPPDAKKERKSYLKKGARPKIRRGVRSGARDVAQRKIVGGN